MSSIFLDFYGYPSVSSFPFLPPPPKRCACGCHTERIEDAVAISCITHMSEFGENFLTNHERTRRARWW